MLPDFRTLVVALWAPALAGALAAATTWLVWFYTTAPCTADNAIELMCRPSPIARYISASVLHHCFIHGSIAVTIVGGSDIMLFLRERHRNNQMMEMMRAFMEEVTEQRRQEVEARREAEERAAEERRQEVEARREAEERAAEERRQTAEERRQAAEERRQAEERAAEERRQATAQATAQQEAFLEALNRLTEAIAQNGRGGQ